MRPLFSSAKHFGDIYGCLDRTPKTIVVVPIVPIIIVEVTIPNPSIRGFIVVTTSQQNGIRVGVMVDI